METKKVIRQQLLARREEISESLRKQYNERILEKVINHPWYKETEEILLYISYGSEVDTLELCRICFQAGKRVYCPKVMDRGRMEFYAIHSLEELTEGYRGIREPSVKHSFWQKHKDKEEKKVLMLMPLVGFDREGNRLGYGGGFYDRYLADKDCFNTIALAFDEQYWKDILPVNAYDIRPRLILTPKKEGQNGGK
ncbi:MAG: 5-formyltetrahydrofolate cyclo-ligase [Lachnospiraceae bacterium]|nr:5-formyltetrahydrofolate cyclo-ligase [Lachnospiraceae bacterium]MDD7027098.1 5-formyltetrahydrofolate cyclo-ligase [Lachnospiraceae bacterium]MDY5700191.1 5-formyltetrahydrofolate cyclo-ligase [Lachnospiraceae bacterium]